MTGRVDSSAAVLAPAVPLIRSGKLKAIAIMNTERSKLFPDLPTVAEQGVPGYNWATWLGIVAPAATPAAIVNKLSEGFNRVAKSPDVAGPMEAEGIKTVGSTPAQLRQLMVTEVERWKKVVQEGNIKLEE